MIAEAERGLAWRRDGNRGGTAVGLARARDISNNKQLPLDTVKRMYSFFARHEVDKKAKGFRPGEKGYPSPGRVAWALWGGDAGFTWSKRITEREKKTKSIESASIPDMTDLVDAYGDPVMKAEVKTEDGLEYPAAAFAYAPDKDTPSGWKLRLWETPELKESRRQVGMAVAALGPGGFRGNRVRIPSDDLPGVKRRVLNAWLKVWPNKERGDAPRVLLSTKRITHTAVDRRQTMMERLGMSDEKQAAADMRMRQPGLTAELPSAQVEAGGYDDEYKDRDNDYGDTAGGPDAMTHLLMAYRQMLDHPECEPLLAPLMEIIHAKQEMMVDQQDETHVVIDPDSMYVEEQKDIREEDGQFCVYSTTGRNFGCYESAEEAATRLEQIERFRTERVAASSTQQLAADHDRLHTISRVETQHVIVHNLIEEELESRGVAAPYLLGDVDDKLELVHNAMSGSLPLAKQAEHRYTLGPVYVPDVEDAHGEFTDASTLQKALWDWVRKGDRRIFIQHSEKVAGEMVEALTWPFPIEADLEVPNQGVTKQVFPADTPFLGVVWKDWAWDLVKAGELRGYSIGGRARRVEADLPVDALV